MKIPLNRPCQPFETLQLQNARGRESVVDLIHDVPTCQALIDRIMLQAEQLIRQRLVHSLN